MFICGRGVITDENWSGRDSVYPNNFKNIFEVIEKYQSDILCLQEVMYDTLMMSPLLKVYDIIASCAINPSIYPDKPYMVISLIRKCFKQFILNTNISAVPNRLYGKIGSSYKCYSMDDCPLSASSQILRQTSVDPEKNVSICSH